MGNRLTGVEGQRNAVAAVSYVIMEIVDRIPFTIDIPGMMATLRIEEGSEDEAAFRELAAKSLESGKPRILYDERFLGEKGADTVAIDGVLFRSRVLRRNTEGVEKVYPHIITCGPEFDRIQVPADDPLRQYWRDSIKQAALTAAIALFTDLITRRHGIRKYVSMHPGSGPADTWPIEQQRELFSLFGDVESAIGVRLTDSFLMIPNKTISGFAIPSETDFLTCSLCQRDPCPGRRAPYDREKAESYRRD
jgi:hypothetical protein